MEGIEIVNILLDCINRIQEMTHLEGGTLKTGIILLIVIAMSILVLEVAVIYKINKKRPRELGNNTFIDKLQALTYLDSTDIMFGGYMVQAVWSAFLFIATCVWIELNIWTWIKVLLAILVPLYTQFMLSTDINQLYSVAHEREVGECNIQRTKQSLEGNIYTGICSLHIGLYAITQIMAVLGLMNKFISIELACIIVTIFIILNMIISFTLVVVKIIVKMGSNKHKALLKKEGLFR